MSENTTAETYSPTTFADSNCGSNITCAIGEFCCKVQQDVYRCEDNENNYDDCQEIGENGIVSDISNWMESIIGNIGAIIFETVIVSVCCIIVITAMIVLHHRYRQRQIRNASTNPTTNYPQAPQSGISPPPPYSNQHGGYPPQGMPPPPPMPYPAPVQHQQQNFDQDIILAGGLMLGRTGFF